MLQRKKKKPQGQIDSYNKFKCVMLKERILLRVGAIFTEILKILKTNH